MLYYIITICLFINATFTKVTVAEGGVKRKAGQKKTKRDRPSASNTFHATHYTYDIHGNVKELVQEIPDERYRDNMTNTVSWIQTNWPNASIQIVVNPNLKIGTVGNHVFRYTVTNTILKY